MNMTPAFHQAPAWAWGQAVPHNACMSAQPDDLLMDLIDRVAQRDEAALKALYDLTSSKLYGLSMRVVRKAEWAEDALQETFLQIWRSAADYRASLSPPMAWLGLIVRSRSLDLLRRRSAERDHLTDEIDDAMADTLEGDSPNPMDTTPGQPAGLGAAPVPGQAGEQTARGGEPGLPARPEPRRTGRAAQAAAGHGEDLDPPRAGPAAHLHGALCVKRPS